MRRATTNHVTAPNNPYTSTIEKNDHCNPGMGETASAVRMTP